MTWEQILSDGRKFLAAAGIAEAELDAWYLFEQAFGISRAGYFLCAKERAKASDACIKRFKDGLERRAKREPLQHILGTQAFMGLEFYVNRHVLIPRQDTETLVETVLSECREKEISVLDMCTGSGCIAVSLAVLGGYTHVEAADISKEALAAAKRNAERLLKGAERTEQGNGRDSGKIPSETVRFRQSDLFSGFDSGDRFDVIVSNPPYIPSAEIEKLEPEVRDYEPRAALDGDEDGLFFYRKLSKEAGRFLKEGGRVYFEIGCEQGEAVCGLLKDHGFTDTRVIKDLAGRDRVVCGIWQAKQRSGPI